jgi:DNA-binding Lrp family transcriptional regulator
VTVQAYILVQTEIGSAVDVTRRIAAVAGVSVAEDVTGPYDVIVRAEAASMEDFGRQVLHTIQEIPGITRTLTCPIVAL